MTRRWMGRLMRAGSLALALVGLLLARDADVWLTIPAVLIGCALPLHSWGDRIAEEEAR